MAYDEKNQEDQYKSRSRHNGRSNINPLYNQKKENGNMIRILT